MTSILVNDQIRNCLHTGFGFAQMQENRDSIHLAPPGGIVSLASTKAYGLRTYHDHDRVK